MGRIALGRASTAYTVNTGDFPPTNGKSAATTAKGNQALKTTAFTLTVANGGTAGFEPSGHLLADTFSNGIELVADAGVDAAMNMRSTGCTAPANAGTANDGDGTDFHDIIRIQPI